MAKKAKRRLIDDIRASLREASDHAAGRPTNVIVHRVKFEIGSGNIFADLGLPDAEGMLLKSQIVVVLHRLLKKRKLTQTAAAKRIGIGQPDLSNVLRGHFRGYSAERLMRMLTAFDQDVEITVRPRRSKSGDCGTIKLSALPA